MHSSPPIPSGYTLSFFQFHQLRTLLQQVAQSVEALVFTEAVLPINTLNDRFTLVVSQPFSVLLRGQLQITNCQIDLTFAPDAIGAFLQSLYTRSLNPTLAALLEQAEAEVRVNDAQQQSDFTLKLIAILTAASTDGNPCQLPEAALHQQTEQERLLYQVTSQIQQSLELPNILKTAVERVRQFLQVDRLVIYRLDAAMAGSLKLEQGGSIILEARASDRVPSVVNFSEAHCFVRTVRYQEVHLQNLAIAVEDVDLKYADMPCLLEFLHQAQVRSKLVAPIIVGEQLWGLLIAHECFQPRHWQEAEQRFLQQIAEHLAIAISQAQLYAEVQEQKQTLEQRVIERTQELRDSMLAAQTANRAKSEFLAGVSHELRTPLTCIIGMSATLLRWSKDALNDRQQHFLHMIHDSGEHLLSLINDILDLSQAEAGKLVLNLHEFSLSHLARQTLKTFTGQVAFSELDLELDLRIDAGHDRFVADPRRLRQVLFNLLGNAVKFTPAGGKVTLRLFAEADIATFQVKDTGIGISEAQLPRLFEKFQQLDASYQRQYSGTGLGLALTKQLVELHGGRITVESTEGVGSVFTVYIPRHQLNGATTLRQIPAADPPRGRLFLIEQDEDTADLICDVVTAAGYQLVWILEGGAAIEQIEALRPAVVVLNVRLPDTDGYRLIHRLRQNPLTKHLKIIALLTANPDNASKDNWQAAGADDYLVQPVRPDLLLQKVSALTVRDMSAGKA